MTIYHKKFNLYVLVLISIFSFCCTSWGQTSGLVGYWKLNEGMGTVANDSSGKNHPGTITSPKWVTDNTMGKVLDFEGTEYVTIPTSAFSTISNKISISLWQYGDAALQPQNNSIFFGAGSGNNRILNAHLPWSNSNVIWDAGLTGTTYDRISKLAAASEFEGKWNHWVFIKDAAAGQMKIYLNGELWKSGSGLTKPITGITSFKIGSFTETNGSIYYYDGMVCEFRLYNTVLTEEEIGQLYGQSSFSSEPLPVDRYVDVDPYPTLTWTPGPLALSNDVYFGTDKDLVTNRDTSVYAGRFTTNSITPGMLMLATTYYWAVDDRNDSYPFSPWRGPVWRFQVRNSKEGYYKDLFIDAGRGVSAYKASGIPAVGLLGYSNEHVDSGDLATTRKIMLQTNSGSWIDDNGTLLYPDGEPRFRMMFVNGGDSGGHLAALEPEGTPTMQSYVFNGGCYTGSCAGAWLSGPSKWGVAPTHLETVGLGTTYTDGTIPDGVTPREIYFGGEWIPAVQLPVSPIIRQNYFPQYFNDFKIHGIYQNGGCRVDPRRTMYSGSVSWDKERNEALVLFDMTWTLRDVEGAQPRNFLTDPNSTETWKMDHNNCMVWSYKGGDTMGKVVPSGSHPEHRQIYGEETPLQESIFQYAYSGFGKATVKAKLVDGQTRLMNDNTRAAYAKIGDLQYHHFTFDVQPGTIRLQINLDGNLYDMNLYAKYGDFAFKGESNVIQATNGTGSDETLTIDNPTPGTWYIGVKCNQPVVSSYGNAYYNYTGKLEVLNGIPYSITAATKKLIEGDIDYDGQVNGIDLKMLSANWLIDNSHPRNIGQLAGKWDFTCIDANEQFAKDSSGYGNTVTFNGDANWAQQGICFDGAGDYLQTQNNDCLQVTDSYTIAFKLNAASSQTDDAGIIVKCGDQSPVPVNHWSVVFGSSATAGKIVAVNGMTKWNTGIELSKIAGNWHNIAIVCGGDFMSSYLDGTQIKWEPFAALPQSGRGHLQIGCDRLKVRWFNGSIDDLSIFNYELSPGEIEGLFDSSSLSNAAGKWMFSDGTAMDSSGNDNHGTLMANASITADQERGNVLNLNGTSYVTLPAQAFADVNEQVTISLWQYGSADQPKPGYAFYATNNYGKVFSANLPWSDGVIYFDAGNSIGGLYDRISKTASSPDDYKGKWNHWLFTKDAAEGTMAVYLNGQLWHSSTGNTKLMTGITSFTISHPSISYQGMVDDFIVYNFAMTESQIENLYQSGLIERKVCPKNPACDLNSDCVINYLDYIKIARNWLK